MLLKAKKFDGSDVQFVVEDKGLLTVDVLKSMGKEPWADFQPIWVTIFVIDGRNNFAETPASISDGQDDARADVDDALLVKLGIDPTSAEPVEIGA